jgi:hypothetical protein
MLSKPFKCVDCGSSEGYRSRPRTFTEKYLLPLLLLRPVRCGDCFRRCYRPIFVPVRERHDSGLTHRAAA